MNKDINKTLYDVDDIFENDPDNPDNILMKIPDDIAEKMGWMPGDVLRVEMENGGLKISKVKNG